MSSLGDGRSVPIPIPRAHRLRHLECRCSSKPIMTAAGQDAASPVARSSHVDSAAAAAAVRPSPSLELYLDFCFAVPTGWARLVCMDVFRYLREQQHEGEDADEVALAARLCMSGFGANALYPIDLPADNVDSSPPPPAFVFPASVYRPLLLVSSTASLGEEEEEGGDRNGDGEEGIGEAGRWGSNDDKNNNDGTRIVVDLRFREQFCISRPTPRYEELLRRTPPVFVGPLSKLLCGARVLCREMEASFVQRQMPLPPWRRAVCVMYRWNSLLCPRSRGARARAGPGPGPGFDVLEARQRRRRERDRRADVRRLTERIDAFTSRHNASPQRA